ncbi:MAG: class I SAM-dependent methyltransferase [Candidatus Kryptoniota bacterium]
MLRKLLFEYMYLHHPRWDTGITPPELVEFVQNHPPGNALELGCGSGTNAIFLAQNGWMVTAVDFSLIAISRAKRKSARLPFSIKWICADVCNLTMIQESFNLILDIGCFHGLNPNQKQKYIRQLDRFLSAGGTFLLYGFINTGVNTAAITDKDIKDLLNFLLLDASTYGVDGSHKSAWFRFIKQNLKME